MRIFMMIVIEFLLIVGLIASSSAQDDFYLTTLNTVELNYSDVHDMAGKDQVCFLATGETGLKILDLSDPDNITQLTMLEGNCTQVEISTSGEIMFCNDRTTGLVTAYSIIDPADPEYLSDRFANCDACMDLVGDTLATVSDGGFIRWIDVSQPDDIQQIAVMILQMETQYARFDGDLMAIKGRYEEELHIIDCSSFQNPAIALSIEVDHLFGISVELKDSYLYVADVFYEQGNGYVENFRIVDLSDPANPDTVSNTPIYDSVSEIFITEDRAVLAMGSDGLMILDISDHENPSILYNSAAYKLYEITLWDNKLLGNNRNDIIEYLNIEDPADLIYLASLGKPGSAIDIIISDNIAYIANHTGGLLIVDVSELYFHDSHRTIYTPG